MSRSSRHSSHQIPAPRGSGVGKSRTELAVEFDAMPLEALADTAQLAAFLNCSEALLERKRWDGSSIPFLKLGRAVRYRKADVLAYLTDKSRTSTTERVV